MPTANGPGWVKSTMTSTALRSGQLGARGDQLRLQRCRQRPLGLDLVKARDAVFLRPMERPDDGSQTESQQTALPTVTFRPKLPDRRPN
jgi:hypothetical protein